MGKFAFPNLQSQRLHSPSPDHLLLVITQGDSVVAHFDGLPDVGRKFDGHWSEAVQNMRAISPGLADFPSQETALDGAAALLRMAVRFAAALLSIPVSATRLRNSFVRRWQLFAARKPKCFGL